MSWSNILTASQFNGYTGKTLAAVRNVKATICAQDWFYAQCLATDDSLWVGRTPNRGDTWFFSNVGTVSATDVALGFAVSQHDALKCWSCGADGVLRGSIDGAVSFSTLYTVSYPSGPINSIEVPYENNPTDQIIYISAEAGSGGGVPGGHDGIFEIVYQGTDVFVNSDTEFGTLVPTAAWWDDIYYKLTMTSGNFGIGALAVDICRYAGGSSSIEQAALGPTEDPYLPTMSSGRSRYSINVCPTTSTITGSSSTRNYSVGYVKISWHDPKSYRVSAIRYGALTFLAEDTAESTYLYKSVNGGGAFSDVTPAEGGSSAFCSMEAATQDGQTIYTLVRADDTEEHHAVVSDDGAGSWTEKSDFNSIAPADADGQASLGAWPYDVQTGYALQYRNPGGTPTGMILSTADLMANWSDKSGDWATAIQATFGLTKGYAGSILPVWSP